jgi:Mrp family chromosome partitioning ATPase
MKSNTPGVNLETPRNKTTLSEPNKVKSGEHSVDAQIANMTEVRLLSTQELDQRNVIYPGMSRHSVLKSFRNLYSGLRKKSVKENFVVLVSSLCDAGGASYVSVNLAAAIAQDTRRTALLVDCNLREKSASGILDIDPDYGLTDYLEDESLDSSGIIYSSGIPGLRIVPLGSAGEDAEQFSSPRMRELIYGMRDRYRDRLIVMDAPPIRRAAETRSLLKLCDYAVLVVPYGRVTRSQILSGVDMVGTSKFAGIVFNER